MLTTKTVSHGEYRALNTMIQTCAVKLMARALREQRVRCSA